MTQLEVPTGCLHQALRLSPLQNLEPNKCPVFRNDPVFRCFNSKNKWRDFKLLGLWCYSSNRKLMQLYGSSPKTHKEHTHTYLHNSGCACWLWPLAMSLVFVYISGRPGHSGCSGVPGTNTARSSSPIWNWTWFGWQILSLPAYDLDPEHFHSWFAFCYQPLLAAPPWVMGLPQRLPSPFVPQRRFPKSQIVKNADPSTMARPEVTQWWERSAQQNPTLKESLHH